MRNRKYCFVAIIFLSFSLPCDFGCTKPPCDAGTWPKINAEQCGQKAIALLDTNGDGKLDGDELDKCPGLNAAFSRLDHDRLGYVTAEAITKRIKQWQASRLGRMRIICIVTHNGKPLEDAEVRFVPEMFLGNMALVASGKTDQKGMATISVPKLGPDDVLGVPPGFYRVEITKMGAEIPVKYNTETVFGIEVASDVENIQDGFKFNMMF
jgi:hypothetical protein